MDSPLVFILFGAIYLTILLFVKFVGINYQYNSIMAAKDNGILGALLTIAGIIGGAFIINELVKKNSKKVVKYKCPTCQTSIDYQQKKCNTCNTDLKWNF